MKTAWLCLVIGAATGGACGGSDAKPDAGSGSGHGPLFPPKPECQGAAVTPLAGTSPQVISTLSIGNPEDGFDLDGDGKPDNKLGNVAGVAAPAILKSFGNYEIVLPLEFFDAPAAAPDTCVKFAIYRGAYVTDTDADSSKAYLAGGDCNDHDAAIHPGAAEVPNNGKDDDCDGLADEDGSNHPSTSDADADHDGVTIAQGDCDDTDATVHKGAVEKCGDGKDNDCDGVADRSTDGSGNVTACNPFDGVSNVDIPLDPMSFVGDAPAIAYKDGTFTQDGAKLRLDAGPALFSVNIPVANGIVLDLRLTGATIKAEVVAAGSGFALQNGHLGGVIDAHTADTIRGLTIDQIGLTPENSLLDAVFANALGSLLILPHAGPKVLATYSDCRTPDIDVDGDGLEAFCESDPNAMPRHVDVCIDGDGTVVMDTTGSDGKTIHCTEAKKDDGSFRFVDGISVELNFATAPVHALTR